MVPEDYVMSALVARARELNDLAAELPYGSPREMCCWAGAASVIMIELARIVETELIAPDKGGDAVDGVLGEIVTRLKNRE